MWVEHSSELSSELSPPIVLVARAIISIVLVMEFIELLVHLMSPTHYTICIIYYIYNYM